MSKSTLRATAVFVALATSSASLLVSVPTASAATTVEAAASAFQLGSYTLSEVRGSGEDITNDLKSAVARPGTPYQATVVHLPAGSMTVSSIVRPANYVYIVAEPGTTVTWKGGDTNLLRFESDKGRTTGGVYGGNWNGDGRSNTLIHLGNADVRLAELAVKSSGKYGIGAYNNSLLSLKNVSTTYNKSQGVYVDASRLEATGLRANNNKVNGVQLSKGSIGTIADSFLDNNGQGVTGTTTGKTGHGLGVASATAFVSSTSMSKNKVCGASLTGSAKVQINDSHLDGNGRHGLGTDDGTTATISDSSLNNNGYNGALASGKGTTVTLQRVTINWAKKMALSVPSGGTAKVTDSLLTAGQDYTISVSSKGKLFLLGGNTVSASDSHGIVVSGKSAIKISGANNRVTGSRGDGLRITGSGTTGRVEAPASFTSNRDSGVVVVSKAKLWMVRGSVFSGNKYNKVEKRSGGKLYSIS